MLADYVQSLIRSEGKWERAEVVDRHRLLMCPAFDDLASTPILVIYPAYPPPSPGSSTPLAHGAFRRSFRGTFGSTILSMMKLYEVHHFKKWAS
jgi:hypothetical protein